MTEVSLALAPGTVIGQLRIDLLHSLYCRFNTEGYLFLPLLPGYL